MTKNSPVSRFSKSRAQGKGRTYSWHNGADFEIHLYAQSLQKAAKALTEQLQWDATAEADWDACPILLLYGRALELHMKAVVGEGCNFLASPTDHNTLYKTRSLRWLAQTVSQIVKKIGWESEFRCQGVSTVVEFSALVNELEESEPVSCLVFSGKHARRGDIPSQLQKSKVAELLPKLDALIDLLEATADALAAEWQQQVEAVSDIRFKPTVH